MYAEFPFPFLWCLLCTPFYPTLSIAELISTPTVRSRNTRSSKGRVCPPVCRSYTRLNSSSQLISEPASSTSQLTAQLSLLGLYAAPTIGDGNCLFRALSDQLYGSPSRHYELRQQICDHVERHRERYEPFVEDSEGGDGEGGRGRKGKGKSGGGGLEGHVRAMRENATYGGHMELSAFADMTRRDVKVIQPGLVYVIEWNSGWGEASPSETKTTPRRSSSVSSKASGSVSSSTTTTPGKSTKKDGDEEKKVKLGKGYYVCEEVSSDDEVDDEDGARGPTVYVA